MAETLRLEIVTPEGVAFSDGVHMVTLPCIEGQLGIYPMHVPVMTRMRAGDDTRRLRLRNRVAIGRSCTRLAWGRIERR